MFTNIRYFLKFTIYYDIFFNNVFFINPSKLQIFNSGFSYFFHIIHIIYQ